MTDIRLLEIVRPVPYAVTFDWLLAPAVGLDQSRELAAAVIVALATDALAFEADELPDIDDPDRRGWWGDLDAKEIWDGWPIGSRLWLLERGKITDFDARVGAAVARAEAYTREALAPFIENRIATRIDVTASRSSTDRNRIDVAVMIYRGPLPAISLRFDNLWDEIR